MVVLAGRSFCTSGTVRFCVERSGWNGEIVFISEDILSSVHQEAVRITVHVCGRAYVCVKSCAWSISSELTAVSITW